MAWGIRQGVSRTAHPKLHVEPPRERIQPSEEYCKANGLWSHLSLAKQDIEIEDRFWPESGRLDKSRKVLPHYMALHGFSVFSQEMCDCIQEFEPEIHQFHEVQILNPNGSPFPRRYFAVQNRNFLNDFVKPELTKIEPKMVGNQPRYSVRGQNDFQKYEVVLDREKVNGLHFYMPADLTGFRHLVSNELYSVMKKRRVIAHLYTAYFREG